MVEVASTLAHLVERLELLGRGNGNVLDFYMATGESHTVRNGVIATVVGGVFLWILGAFWASIKPVISWFWEKAQAFAGLFGDTYSAPGWALAILGLLALVTVIRAVVALRSNYAAPHLSYIEDTLFGIKWRWSWEGGDISNLWCFCPACDSELVYDDRVRSPEGPPVLFICERCNRTVVGRVEGNSIDYALDAVRREIRRRVRTEQYAVKQDVG